MRDILFKAKRIDSGEWVEGHYYSQVHHKDTIEEEWYHFIKPIGSKSWESIRVDATTLCQYTGLTDKNGNKIWGNDVVFVTDDNGCSGQIDTGIGEIDFLEGLWYISGSVQNALYDINKCFLIEVIGNIFDNPELVVN